MAPPSKDEIKLITENILNSIYNKILINKREIMHYIQARLNIRDS